MKKRILSLVLCVALMFSFSIPCFAHTEDLIVTSSSEDNLTYTSLDAQYLPSKYSSREQGYTTKVKNQTGTNICWAYCSLDCLETLMLKNGVTVGSLSPSAMDIWGTKQPDGTGFYREFNQPGSATIATAYLSSWSGAKSLEDCPITIERSDAEPYLNANNVALANSIAYLNASDKASLKSAIYTYGSIVGSFNYNTNYLDRVRSSYYCDMTDQQIINRPEGHSICIVGWDDNYSKDNFREDKRPSRNGAWYCKNSWGESWCRDGGYFWISYEDTTLFSPRFSKTFAITSFDLPQENITMNQITKYNATDYFCLNYDTPDRPLESSFVNILDFKKESTLLTKINFECNSANAPYKVHLVPIDSDGKPSNNYDTWELIAQGNTEYAGVLSISFDNPIDLSKYNPNNQSSFKLGVSVSLTTTTAHPYGIGITRCMDPLQESTNKLTFIPDTVKNGSYLMIRDFGTRDTLFYTMQGYSSYDIAPNVPDPYGANFIIRAMTKSDTNVLYYGDVNLDKNVDALDAVYIQKALADIYYLTDDQKLCADANGDNIADVKDATTIQKYLASIPCTNRIYQRVR